jgi:uncharacterized protein
MTQPAKSQEPSMEEILASIRRIIADDDASKGTPKAAEPPKPAPRPAPPRSFAPLPSAEIGSPEPPAEEPPMEAAQAAQDDDANADILDLTESMTTPSYNQPAAGPEPAPQFRRIEGISDVGFDDGEQKPQPAMSARQARDVEQVLLSTSSSAAVDSAFHTLAQTVLVQNARTLEDLVREMLRPMLKSWLDDNLPGMVERLVRAEIERVARGR